MTLPGMSTMIKYIRRYIFAGLVVWLPVLITFMVFRFMLDLLDATISILPKEYQPDHLVGFHVPGVGIVFSLIILIITGTVVTNFLGQKLFSWGEKLLVKIPLVSSIYNTSKQVIQTIFSSNSQAFRKVLLIEYPRAGIYSLAFLTGDNTIPMPVGHSQLLSVFVPTTPNPTSGFLLMIPREQTWETSLSVDEALKLIISLGVMQPKIML